MNYAMKDDAELAAWLVEVGKTSECICEIETMSGVHRVLIYDHTCPVHYPQSRKILKGEGA